MNKDKNFNEMREAICKDANTQMCNNDECPHLYRCSLGEPTIDNLDILAEKGFGNIEKAITEFAEKVGFLFCPECDYDVYTVRETIINYGKEFINALKQ